MLFVSCLCVAVLECSACNMSFHVYTLLSNYSLLPPSLPPPPSSLTPSLPPSSPLPPSLPPSLLPSLPPPLPPFSLPPSLPSSDTDDSGSMERPNCKPQLSNTTTIIPSSSNPKVGGYYTLSYLAVSRVEPL